ncbi:MAG: tetrahydrofolate dehydrogenase/cyclohydrolase catalytic domain-containing protein, partial [Mucinivorans sp.]
MEIIDGKKVSQQLKELMREEVSKMEHKPSLTAILVGNDGASETYVGHKERACAEIGFHSQVLRFGAEISQQELLQEIEKLNNDPQVDGFIVQMPLPKHIDEQVVIEAIDPSKDVDGFTPVNVGKMVLGLPCYVSATPLGICNLLKHYRIDTRG